MLFELFALQAGLRETESTQRPSLEFNLYLLPCPGS